MFLAAHMASLLRIIDPDEAQMRCKTSQLVSCSSVRAKRLVLRASAGVPVTIYQGQLDLICCTLGVETWLQRLKWPGMAAFDAAPHEPFYAHGHKDSTAGFSRRHQNLAMYYVMSAGAS